MRAVIEAMLTSNEQEEIIGGWNATTGPCPAASAHELFETRSAQAPDAVAVVHENAELTYGELNKRANKLAHCLRAHGVGPDILVGLLADRSPEMIVGLLAVLKAGGAYVPLDPGYPPDRLAAMIKDGALSVLLTQRARLADLPQNHADVICLDSDWETIAQNSERNPAVEVSPANLAYVIYTSGSTGAPKGVLIEHHSLSNYVQTAIHCFELEPNDRVLQFASISFDTSAEEIFPCLARGATLVLRNDSMASSTSAFLDHCRAWKLTVLDLPTAFWHELTASIDDEGLSLPSSIRLVIIGGERALPERVAAWHKCVGRRVRLLNTYGPTETTIVATIADLSEAEQSGSLADAPIGRAIPNARTYILDRHGQAVPAGDTGELYIAGLGVARGYLNRPELTADRFVPDPFTIDAGERMYRTGDLARYGSDGTIQLLGRIDHQVKINGFRIELEEIESAMRAVDCVHDAAVVAREDRPGEKYLVAYIVPRKTGESLFQATLRDHVRDALKQKLPVYMLPAIFIALDRLPVSSNGKLDRTALPPPDFVRCAAENYARPRDPLERHLVEIWEEILDVRPIGIRDDFFDLGGHSLLAVRMFDRVERAFGTRLALATLFKAATIEHLAAALKHQERVGARSAIVRIQRGSSTRPFFFLHGDFNGGGFYCVNLARGLGVEHSFYAVQPHGLDGGVVPPTIEAMAESRIKEIRALQPHGPYLLGGYCNGGTVAFEMARQLQSQGETIDLLILLCASASNARFKLIDAVVSRWTRVKRLGPDYKLESFLAFRERLVRLEGIRDYYLSRIGELSRMQGRKRIAFLAAKAAKASANIAPALASVVRNARANEAPESTVKTAAANDRRQRVGEAYTRALLGYVEKQYRGRVTLLWPGELPLDDPADPTAGWGQVASEVDLHKVPGGHITCITSNVSTLAKTLRACLDETQSAARR